MAKFDNIFKSHATLQMDECNISIEIKIKSVFENKKKTNHDKTILIYIGPII